MFNHVLYTKEFEESYQKLHFDMEVSVLCKRMSLGGLPRQPFIPKNVAAQRARNQAKQASRQPPARHSASTTTIGGGATLAPGQVYVRTFVFQKLGVPRMIN